MNTGKRLRNLINERGLKQRAVAKKANISENTLSRILNDLTNPSADSLAGLAAALDVTTDFILGVGDAKKTKAS